MRWIVTVDLPSTTTGIDHQHIDVSSPLEGSHVIHAINEAIGHGVATHIQKYEEFWQCQDPKCGGWRLEPLRQVVIDE